MFEYKLDFYQNMLTVTILIISYIIILGVGVRNRKDLLTTTLLFIWHTFFSVIYFVFSLFNVSDAKGYYRASLTDDNFSFYPGSPFVKYFTSFFSKGLDASYLNTTLVFNIISTIGLVLLYLSTKNYLKILPRYWLFILFIPSMSFWSASLSKDSISFFSVCLFLYAVTTGKKANILIPFSFFAMFMVRPHVAAVILISYIIYFIINSKIHFILKLLTLPVIAFGMLLSVSFVQQYIGLDDANIESLDSYVQTRQSYGQDTGSYVDISSMSYPMKMFTYSFRPLPFEAHSAVALISSLENTILLLLFIYIIFKSKFNLKPFIENRNLWLFTYVFLVWSILAMTTTNLGIATRQKWMFMPVIIYLLIYVFYEYKLKSVKTKKLDSY